MKNLLIFVGLLFTGFFFIKLLEWSSQFFSVETFSFILLLLMFIVGFIFDLPTQNAQYRNSYPPPDKYSYGKMLMLISVIFVPILCFIFYT